jgi:hypothetical protein
LRQGHGVVVRDKRAAERHGVRGLIDARQSARLQRTASSSGGRVS